MAKWEKGQAGSKELSLGEAGRGRLLADLGSPVLGPRPIYGEISERLNLRRDHQWKIETRLLLLCTPQAEPFLQPTNIGHHF